MRWPVSRHAFHLVGRSPWPVLTAVGAFNLLSFTIGWLYGVSPFSVPPFFFLATFFGALPASLYCWAADIVCEATHEGQHTLQVRGMLEKGMQFFIISEIMLFLSFFASFFYVSYGQAAGFGNWEGTLALALPRCSAEVFEHWPPLGIVSQSLPPAFCNTVVLILSGCAVTWAHLSLVSNKRGECLLALALTVCLGSFFSVVQGFEYCLSDFSINDSVYGSCFFLITGFHGVHVVIGTALLSASFARMLAYHFTAKVHVGLQAAVWYWHFVDLVWVAVFIWMYCMPFSIALPEQGFFPKLVEVDLNDWDLIVHSFAPLRAKYELAELGFAPQPFPPERGCVGDFTFLISNAGNRLALKDLPFEVLARWANSSLESATVVPRQVPLTKSEPCLLRLVDLFGLISLNFFFHHMYWEQSPQQS